VLVLGLVSQASGAISGILILILLLGAVVLTGLVGVIIERVLIRPLRKAHEFMPLLITASAGIVIEQILKNFYPQGSNPQIFPIEIGSQIYDLGLLSISGNEIIIMVSTVFLFGFTFWFIKRTKVGSQIEAISQDFEAASMMGINVNRGITITFFLGASLAAMAGFMNGIYYNVFRYDMGAMAGIKGFSAAVVGGLGSIFGAIIGGFVMAFVETFAAAYIPGASPYRDVFSFLVVLMFLVFQPSGILGQVTQEKV
jgi:branched-chain amino acid transport system permease protein